VADNVGYTPGTGATVAADEIGGVLYQRVKVTSGVDGTATDVSSSNPMPVSVGNFPATQPVSGSVSVSNFPATQDVNITGISESAPLPVADADSGNLLRRILQMLMAPLGYDKSLQRQRGTVLVESGTVTTVSTVTTVTTVSAVTSLNNLDGYMARMQVLDQNRTSWALCVRTRIT
jgi:hypothetical protein